MRYYKLDENGWPLASYARPQPDKDLQHLPDHPSEHHRWDGEKWIEDILPSVWYERIAEKREQRLTGWNLNVALSQGTYTIPVTERSLALILPAKSKARERMDYGPFPTAQGIVEFGPDDLEEIYEVLYDHSATTYRREAQLHQKVANGTMTEDDLEEGWPG